MIETLHQNFRNFMEFVALHTQEKYTMWRMFLEYLSGFG